MVCFHSLPAFTAFTCCFVKTNTDCVLGSNTHFHNVNVTYRNESCPVILNVMQAVLYKLCAE